MATIDKKLAEELLEKVKKQKRPIYLCIVKYWNTMCGKESYAYCKGEAQFVAVVNSPVVSDVQILWRKQNPKADAFFAELGFGKANSDSWMDEFLDLVCEAYKDAFIAYVDQGENKDDFDEHLDSCENCARAVEKAFEKSAEAFEKISEELHKKD